MFRRPCRIAALVSVLCLTTTLSYADVVTDWNVAALDAIRTFRTSPPAASRALAILHLAIYDAVNGIARTHEQYLVKSTVAASASKHAAAIAAASVALTELFPEAAENFGALRDQQLVLIADGPSKNKGVTWGEAVARELLLTRVGDGFDATVAAPDLPLAPGVWVPTPPASSPYLLPQWGFVAPFAMPGSAFFRPPGPPALDSARYAADVLEVKALGAATGSTRTPEQSLIALFWADGAGTETPPGHWNTIARVVSAARGTTLEENARLFALLNAALADAAVCAWDAKYAYDFWRPVTAIRNADADGNPATTADPGWLSFISTPPFPDYVSGHSTFSGAAATVLAKFYGTDAIAFSVGSDFLPGEVRQFSSFSAAAREAGISRLYGGIHFRSANEDGMQGGIKVAEWTFDQLLRPKGNRSR